MRGYLATGVVAVAALWGSAATAQALSRPHAELPSATQPTRQAATTGYTLALIWTPEACRSARRRGDDECRAGAARSGFILHGLWPDGDGADRWPQYCHPAPVLGEADLRRGIGATPSAQLLQHEWAKHGTCMSGSASVYFDTESALFRALTLPDLRPLGGRRSATVGDVQQAFARADAHVPADAVRVRLNRSGYLEEVWLCLDLQRRYRSCTAGQGGGADRQTAARIETRGSTGYAGVGRSGTRY